MTHHALSTSATRMRHYWRLSVPAAALLLGLATPTTAQEDSEDLTMMSIEELMNVKVSLASRGEQTLSEIAAAAYVLTREDIRRSGATSIAELLRQVPGMQVARIDANKWAVTARGFNERFANKLLVQIDGRTVYTPSFSGVYWEELDVVLEDVERIEVIRGPGATLWGANAVNGIVNVVTRSAADTQGKLLNVSLGSEERALVSARHGGRFGADAHYRGYLKYTSRDEAYASGGGAGDEWYSARAGSRLDWEASEVSGVHLQGEVYLGGLTNLVSLPQLQQPSYRLQEDDIDIFGGHLLGRWDRDLTERGRVTAQVYYNIQDREEFVRQRTQTIDLDVQHATDFGRNELVWGGGYRLSWDEVEPSLAIALAERNRRVHRVSFFAQDDLALHDDRLHLILGSKFEHNEFTGFEAQPNLRLRWTPNERQTVWGGVSRAVRTPARGELDVQVILPDAALPAEALPDGVGAGFAAIAGNPDLGSESVIAYEAGVRLLPVSWLLLDAAAFVHDYDELRSVAQGSAYIDSSHSTPVAILPLVFGNAMHGTGRGVEIAADAHLTESFRLRGHYSYIDIDLEDPVGISAEIDEGNFPAHQVFLGGSYDLERVAIDAALRWVDNLPGLGVGSYSELDLRAGYSLADGIELELTARNALSGRHLEFDANSLHSAPAQLQRSLRVGLIWRY